MSSFRSLSIALGQRGAGALLVGLAVFAAACGGGSDADSVDTAGGGASEGAPQSFEDLDFSSPIGEFLGIDYSASDDMEAEFAEMEREAGRITAECMRDLGFEYTPPDTGSFTSFGSPDGIPYFSEEWIEKYGFGITTQRFPQSAVGDLVGFPDENFGPDEEYVDPNEEYLESLSDSEREAYQEALWGQPPDFGPEGPTEDQMMEFQPSGCQNEAFEQAFSDGPGGNQQAFFEAFGDEMEALEERVQADPRVLEFEDSVAACLADEGVTWTGMEDMYERFEPRLEALQPAAFRSGVDPFEEAGLDPEEMTDREMQDFFNELNRLDDAGLRELAELQAEEIALAKSVVACGGGPLNEQVVLGEVRVEYEQEFLDRNADALAEFATD